MFLRLQIFFLLFLINAIGNNVLCQDNAVKALQEESIKTSKKLVLDTSYKT
jgi:hypothetical protein